MYPEARHNDASRQDLVASPKKTSFLIPNWHLYVPEPPLLIRRALDDDTLPTMRGDAESVTVPRGGDMFISTYNLHRSSELWDAPDTFDPTRWDRPTGPAANAAAAAASADGASEKREGERWAGYDPELRGSGLYSNEVERWRGGASGGVPPRTTETSSLEVTRRDPLELSARALRALRAFIRTRRIRIQECPPRTTET